MNKMLGRREVSAPRAVVGRQAITMADNSINQVRQAGITVAPVVNAS
jgi:hypothetical protein